MDVAQLVEPRVVIPVVVGSSPIVHPRFDSGHSRQKPRLLPAGFGVMSAEIAAQGAIGGRSRQRPRSLPAVDEVMSAEIAAGDFGQ